MGVVEKFGVVGKWLVEVFFIYPKSKSIVLHSFFKVGFTRGSVNNKLFYLIYCFQIIILKIYKIKRTNIYKILNLC